VYAEVERARLVRVPQVVLLLLLLLLLPEISCTRWTIVFSSAKQDGIFFTSKKLNSGPILVNS
jgi:hypothetical protein